MPCFLFQSRFRWSLVCNFEAWPRSSVYSESLILSSEMSKYRGWVDKVEFLRERLNTEGRGGSQRAWNFRGCGILGSRNSSWWSGSRSDYIAKGDQERSSSLTTSNPHDLQVTSTMKAKMTSWKCQRGELDHDLKKKHQYKFWPGSTKFHEMPRYPKLCWKLVMNLITS